jgi:hypothetical protein
MDYTQRARLGGMARSALYDGKDMTAKAREKFLGKFMAGIPADLPEAERIRRAEVAKKLHFTRLAYLSAKARAK